MDAMKVVVLLSVLTVGAGFMMMITSQPSRADVRALWHCHPYTDELVRCHRQFRGRLVEVGSPAVKCVPPSHRIRTGESGRSYIVVRDRACRIARKYFQ